MSKTPRLANGQYTFKYRALKFIGVIAIVGSIMTIGIVGAKGQIETRGTDSYTKATTTSKQALEALIEVETEKQMLDVKFIAKMKEQARLEVLYRFDDKVNSELYDYREALDKELKGLEALVK